MVKLCCDDATYERLKMDHYRLNKMLEEIEQLNRCIEEAVAKRDKEGEALLRQEKIYRLKAKNSLDECVKFLEFLCFVKRDEE